MEEIEASTRGMSVGKYRDYASDVYFKSYLLLKKVHKEQGERLVFELIS